MTTTSRARAQQGPRTRRKIVKKTTTTAKRPVQSAFRQSSNRDYVKKMTVEVDRDLHAELKVIAARQGLTIREIIESYLEEYVKGNR